MRKLLALTLTMFLSEPLAAHDIYMTLHEKMDISKMLCCGGDEKTGDCEAVTYQILPNGDAIFTSRRYGKPVLVAKDKIGWFGVPGGEYSEAHWCGRPGQFTHTDPTQIDPEFTTYCAFIAPGGV
jgi:hypothetical protein